VFDLTFLYAHEVACTAENSFKDAEKKNMKATDQFTGENISAKPLSAAAGN